MCVFFLLFSLSLFAGKFSRCNFLWLLHAAVCLNVILFFSFYRDIELHDAAENSLWIGFSVARWQAARTLALFLIPFQ